MKRYATTYSNGHTIESSSAHEALNFRFLEDDQVWLLKGKQVTSKEFFDAVQSACDLYLEKKMETHKRVRVLYGSSVASYVYKWIPR